MFYDDEDVTRQKPPGVAARHEVLKSDPLFLDVTTLDFGSTQEIFTKIADPAEAIFPEMVTEVQEVKTLFRREGGTKYVETVNIAQPGDIIITGAQGERYVLSRDTFDKLYQPLTNSAGRVVEGAYLPCNRVKRLPNPTGREIVIVAPWGGYQTGEAHCWIVESQVNDDRYIIEADAFAATYQPASK